MGYSFYLISKEKQITYEDYETAIQKLSSFNLTGFLGRPVCDIAIDNDNYYIRISGSFTISGKYVEGFVLNLLMNLLDLGYKPKVLSRDWNYGSDDDWEWLDNI